MIHPALVEGQIHGAIAQGLGQVLGEEVVYDADGQLLTGSFMDYPMPRADDLPPLRLAHHVVPCRTNPNGVKGAGESEIAGCPSRRRRVRSSTRWRAGASRAWDLPMSQEHVPVVGSLLAN